MPSKEEYLTHLDYGVKTCPAIYDAFKELIEKHFEPKEHAEEFKYFKLHSDSTLKNLTKEELIGYIKMLYHNWGVTDEQLKNCIDANTKLKGKYSKILDDVHDYRFETHCMKMTIRNLCEHFGVKNETELKNIYLNKPYKLEDLKENMWCFDKLHNDCFHICVKMINNDGMNILGNEYFYRTFEENRFYPVEMANLSNGG